MMQSFVKRGWAILLVMCVLTGACGIAGAEEAGSDAYDAAIPAPVEKSLVLQTIEHLKTVDWRALPQELRDFIDEISWQDLQQKIKNFDWRGALQTLKSFFTETPWGEVGKEIERQFELMFQEGAQGLQSLGEAMSRFSLDDFVDTLKSGANNALQRAQGWAQEAREAVEDCWENAQDAVSDFLRQIGIY